jgi:hypothetical protein
MSPDDAPFSRRALALVIGVGLASFAVAVGIAVLGDGSAPPSAGADSYSRSALGHHALVELLRRLDVPVVVSRHDSVARAATRGVVVVAEPRLLGDPARVGALLDQAGTALVVLPKWHGAADPGHRAWIARADLYDLADVNAVLAACGLPGRAVRPGAPARWTIADGLDLGAAEPTLAGPQLIEGSGLDPVVSAGDAILVGHVARGDRELWVLTDPDLVANHGLGRGDNAVLAVAILDKLRNGGPVVVDETLHGHVSLPSVWRELATFPLSLAPASALLALLALVWAGTGRFGAPVPAGPGLRAGKLTLIDNIAELMRSGDHVAFALDRFLQLTVQEVARRTHAPPGAEPRAWLAQLERTRRPHTGLDALDREVRAVRAEGALAAAARIHRWRQEMIDGSVDGPRR